MFAALISTFLSSWATVLWKNALSYNAPKEIFNWLSFASIFLVTIAVYFFWSLDFSWVNIINISIIFWMALIWFIRTIIYQKSYTIDKISTLMPYDNINKILSIILAFFIFSDVSLVTLIITIIAIIVIITFSIDLKTFKIPKSILMFSFAQALTSILTLLIWYLLLQISDISLFVLSYIAWIIFVWIILYFKNLYKEIPKLPRKFFIYRLSASHLWGFSYLLSLFVMKELWVSVTILLSFLWLWITLLFSYLFLKDIPSKKDIFLTIIVSLLVWLWYYFK